MKKLEVRCCCDPNRLLGWLPVPDHVAESGKHVLFPVRGGEILDLPIGVVFSPAWGYRTTINSNETPLEVLRDIPGFVENPL